nr:Acetyltransferase (GNAT) domain protein [uncultured bacterium]
MDPEAYRLAFEMSDPGEQQEFFGYATRDRLEEERLRWQQGMVTFNKSFCWFTIFLKAEQTAVGWCGFHTWYIPHRRAEIGYEISGDDYKRSGLMTEALAAVIDYGFTELNLNRIEAFVEPGNEASIKLLEKSDFLKEGLLREHYFKNNEFQDSVVYGLFEKKDVNGLNQPGYHLQIKVTPY